MGPRAGGDARTQPRSQRGGEIREAGESSVTLVTAILLASSTEPLWSGRLGVQHFLEATTGKNQLLGVRRRRDGLEVRADLFLLRMGGRDSCPGRRGRQVRLGNKEGFTWQPPGARRMVTLHLSQRGLGALLRKLGGRHQALNSSQEVASPSRQAGEGVAHSPTYPPSTRGRPKGAASRNSPLI